MSTSRKFLRVLQRQCRSKLTTHASSIKIDGLTGICSNISVVQGTIPNIPTPLVQTVTIPNRWFSTEESQALDDETTAKTSSAPPSSSSPSKKTQQRSGANKNSKRKKSRKKMIQLLQLQDMHTKEAVEKVYEEKMAHRTELTKLKWIKTLEKKLKKKPTKKKAVSNWRWEETQKLLNRKAIPVHVKDAFWDMIVAESAAASMMSGGAMGTKSKKKKKQQRFDSISDGHVALFSRARDLAVEFPFFWSATRKRKVQKALRKDKKQNMDTFLQERSELLVAIHNSKSTAEKELEARELMKTLQMRLPTKYVDKLIKLFDDYIEACESEKANLSGMRLNDGNGDSTPEQKKRIKMLYSNIQPQTLTHVHLVASILNDFFYVNISDDGVISDSDDNVMSDSRVQAAQKAWEDVRDDHVASLLSIQSLLLEEHNQKIESMSSEESSTASDGNESTSEVDSVSLDDGSEESILNTFEEAAKGKKPVVSNKVKKKRYTIFEAIQIGEWESQSAETNLFTGASIEGSPLEAGSFPSEAPLDRLVFIDNLPIDMSSNRLMDAYSRCGDVEALHIFNRRPELDPGRRSDDSRKKIRNPSASRKKWQRPRTPLYAMVLYRDSAGAAQAVSDPLRIFGMVLDKHLIRSYRAADMTKLYIEDIAGAQSVTSVEYKLSQILHPELYVCLDAGGRQRRSSNSTSCEIKFPSFEAAYWSYLKLSSELDLLTDEECELHWMETPRDALMYWTRQLNF